MRGVLLPLVMAGLGLAGGVGAGLMFGPEPDPEEAADAASEQAPAQEDATEDDAEGTEFARLNNQFIVPVVRDERVEALVVLTLTLEVAPGGTEEVYSLEPRLRDRILRVLFDHANIGGFDVGFTQTGTMTLLRQGLLEAAQKTLGPTVRDILIVDIVRQEV